MKVAEIYRRLPVIFCTLLLAGLLWSRALLSITEAVVLLYGIILFFTQSFSFYKESIVWSLCPLLFFGLGLYQKNNIELKDFDYLLTLAAYPSIAFLISATNNKQRIQIFYCLIAAVFISLLYPLGWYILHIKEAHLLYGMGQSLPTFMDADHVRYGLFICSGLLVLLQYKLFTKKIQTILIVLLVAVIIFMSVRTAWVALIIILSIQLFQKTKWQYFLLGFFLFALICLTTYKLVPTIQQKINYTIYDWQMFNPKVYTADFSDGARRNINRIAWEMITIKHQSNIGWSNIPPILQENFHQQYPTKILEYGWPFNQYLFWVIGGGWWTLILFLIWFLYPALSGWKKSNNSLLSWTFVIAVSCLVECTLNYQYGVFLHAFVIFLLWHDTKTI